MVSPGSDEEENAAPLKSVPSSISPPRTAVSSGVFYNSAFNLFNTALGGGIALIPLPYACKRAGVYAMPVIVMFAGLFAAFTANLMVRVSVATGEKNYSKAAHRTLGTWGGTLIDVLVIGNNFGACVACLDVVGDVVPALLGVNRSALIFVLAVFLLPVCMSVKRIESLSLSSAFATACTALFCAMVLYKGNLKIDAVRVDDFTASIIPPRAHPVTAFDILVALAEISMAWCMHFNVLPIFQGVFAVARFPPPSSSGRASPEMHAAPPSFEAARLGASRTMGGVISCTCVAIFAVYTVVGVGGYLTHGAHTTSDTMADYTVDPIGRFCRNMLVAGLASSYPLLALEGIHSVRALVAPDSDGHDDGDGHGGSSSAVAPADDAADAEGAGLGAKGGGYGSLSSAPPGGGADGGAGAPPPPLECTVAAGFSGDAPAAVDDGDAAARDNCHDSDADDDVDDGVGGERDRDDDFDRSGSERVGLFDLQSREMLALLWVLASTGFAAAFKNTGSVLAVVGAVCAVPQMFILPPLMVLCMAEPAAEERRKEQRAREALLQGEGRFVARALLRGKASEGAGEQAAASASAASVQYSQVGSVQGGGGCGGYGGGGDGDGDGDGDGEGSAPVPSKWGWAKWGAVADTAMIYVTLSIGCVVFVACTYCSLAEF
jgi:amino acid permease